ncbi:MAG TPA: 2-hydroxychromene-2-carboxylate isomerase [Burkholderiales bacterium]|nr:2-hydroxychromene-2-carboxylate isomerase [Burkholderiales bacterium]
MGRALDFYFDFSSPYGYFAAARIDELAARHDRTVNWRPILLGAVFKTTGQRPLTAIPLKGPYAKRDLHRSARLYGIPFAVPSKFPIAATGACRAFYFLSDSDPARARKLAFELYKAYFTADRDITSADVIVDIATSLGVDKEGLTAALNDPALKERLRSEVDTAIGRGVFGSPYIIVDGEPFWGADRLDHIDRWLTTAGW